MQLLIDRLTIALPHSLQIIISIASAVLTAATNSPGLQSLTLSPALDLTGQPGYSPNTLIITPPDMLSSSAPMVAAWPQSLEMMLFLR